MLARLFSLRCVFLLLSSFSLYIYISLPFLLCPLLLCSAGESVGGGVCRHLDGNNKNKVTWHCFVVTSPRVFIAQYYYDYSVVLISLMC